MARVAFIAPEPRLRAVLVTLAEAGVAQLVGPVPAPEGEAVEALRRLERAQADGEATAPVVAPDRREVGELEQTGRRDLLAGEVELDRRSRAAIRHRPFAALVAWVPRDELDGLQARLESAGAAVIELPRPPLVEPPTLLRPRGIARPFRALVDTYGPARYRDVDPTPFAAASFVLMFGMMFGDLGQGLLLALLGLALRHSRDPRWERLRPLWPFAVAGGLAAAGFGILYGEFFGPTDVIPVVWLSPLDEPTELLAAAVAIGALLLAASYALGTVNRIREGGLRAAVFASSGMAGFALFAGIGLVALALLLDVPAAAIAAAVVGGAGIALLFAGFAAEAGSGGSALGQAAIETFDSIVRVGSNLVSFTRLAAFGLMHAAIGAVVLDGAGALWGGVWGSLAAIVVFTVGTAAAFALEALVAGVQAMRLEYYELFSRVYAGEGEAFSPWRLPVATGPTSMAPRQSG